MRVYCQHKRSENLICKENCLQISTDLGIGAVWMLTIRESDDGDVGIDGSDDVGHDDDDNNKQTKRAEKRDMLSKNTMQKVRPTRQNSVHPIL